MMANQRGWWELKTSGLEHANIDLSDCDKEHIAEMIKQGYTSGEIVEDEK